MKTALAPPVAPLACPKCDHKFPMTLRCDLVRGNEEDDAYQARVTCPGCSSRLWLYLGAIDANGVGVTHLVPV